MKLLNSPATAVLHLIAWLISLPLLLFVIFRSVPYSSYISFSQDDKFVLVGLLISVSLINSGILVPRFLYIKKIKYYLLTASLLILISAIFDLTFTSAITPVLTFIDSFSWYKISAFAAAMILSTSVRMMYDQKSESGLIEE